MAELFMAFDPLTVILVLMIGIPSIINFIGWCKRIWNQRQQFQQENIDKGKRIEAREEREENRLQKGESRMTTLESDVADLKGIAKKQQELIELLIQSDELDIKSWIKIQHEKWMPKGCIDSQTLDLLEQRYAIYEKEGGNSWAKKLMTELRSLPVVTVIPIPVDHRD